MRTIAQQIEKRGEIRGEIRGERIGEIKGKIRGMEKGKQEIAIAMRVKGLPADLIQEVTKLPRQAIDQLMKQ